MSRLLLDYDPLNGISCYMSWQGDQVVMTHEQDVRIIENVLEANKRDQADDQKTKDGIKNDMWLYARIPTWLEMQWKDKYGVDLNDKNHHKKVWSLINDPEYRWVKTTSKYHGG
jgi:hypothetical protein